MWRNKPKDAGEVKHENDNKASKTKNDSKATQRKKRIKRQRKARFGRNALFVLIVILLLGMIGSIIASALFPGRDFLSIPSKLLTKAITPVQQWFADGAGWFFDYIEKLKLRSTIEKEYEQLYDKYDELLSEVMLVEQLKDQLSAYQDLEEEMQTHSQYASVAARVIATDSQNYFSILTLNVGTRQGVSENMAVVKSGGLVGYTYDVTETSCKVQTIISSDASIAAMLQSTHYQGTIKGTMGIDGQPMCRMYYLNESHLPRQGDVVVTSGVGQEFPKGIPIGTVKESTRGMADGKSYVVVEPIVDFERIEYVIVYCYTPSYAEKAENRGDSSQTSFIELATARPVPTFALDVSDGFNITPTPETSSLPESAAGTPTPSVTPEVKPEHNESIKITATPVPNLSYDDIPGTPTPEPTPTPSPTPVPTATYSLDDLKVEAD